MKPDNVCAKYAGEGKVPQNRRLTVQMLKSRYGNETDLVLIEGEAEALEFLGKVLIAQSKYEKDCAFYFGPNTAGNAFFTNNSTLGFYIHRLPCQEEPGLKLARPVRKPPIRPMKFTEVYAQVIKLWPRKIDLTGAQPEDDKCNFENLSGAWDRVEDGVGYKDPWTELMVWAMFQAFHDESLRLFEQEIFLLEPRKVPQKAVEYYFHRGMTEKGSDFRSLLKKYTNDLE